MKMEEMRFSLLGRLNLFPQVLVLPLKVGRPQGDLVLLESLRLPAPPGRLLVLQALLPILLILGLLGNGVLLPLLDDGLRSELLHIKGPGLGIEIQARHCGQCNVLGGKLKLDLELTLALLLEYRIH